MNRIGARRRGAPFVICLFAFFCASVAMQLSALAAITFVAPAITLQHSNLAQSGSFDVYVSSSASPQPNIGDYTFTLDLPSQSNVTFTGGETTSAAHPYIFGAGGPPSPLLSPDGDSIEGADFTLTFGGVGLVDGAGLLRVNYTIAPGFVGSFPLTFETSSSASSLDDGLGNSIPLTFTTGSLSVVPEPNAAVLGLLGAICVAAFCIVAPKHQRELAAGAAGLVSPIA